MKRIHEYFKVSTFKKKKKVIAIMTEEELLKINKKEFDAVIDKAHGEYSFTTCDGQELVFLQRIPTIGVSRWMFFLTLLRSCLGKPWTPADIGAYNERYIPNNNNSEYRLMRRLVDTMYVNEVIRGSLYLWRKQLKESRDDSFYFLSQKPLAVSISSKRSILLIEPQIEGLKEGI